MAVNKNLTKEQIFARWNSAEDPDEFVMPTLEELDTLAYWNQEWLKEHGWEEDRIGFFFNKKYTTDKYVYWIDFNAVFPALYRSNRQTKETMEVGKMDMRKPENPYLHFYDVADLIAWLDTAIGHEDEYCIFIISERTNRPGTKSNLREEVCVMTNKEHLEKLSDEAIDVAEMMIRIYDVFTFMDILDQNDIKLRRSQADELLNRCHSAVADEITKYVKEELEKDLPEDPEDPEDDYEYDEYFDPNDYIDPVKEQEAWEKTVTEIKDGPCPKCGGTETKVSYNTHDGKYCTYDTVCKNCGYVLMSQLD